tara:strand:+ start:7719 stop:8384 length:666 start_codon:yes stop_codon:yes gene_type:complete
MKDVIDNWNKFLLNESMSRVHQHITEHDSALLTAHRADPSDMSACLEGAVEPGASSKSKKAINKERYRELKAVLLDLGYGVRKVKGSFIENYGNLDKQVEVKEDSLFVHNHTDEPNFVEQIIKLGKRYCQDAVLIIPQGGDGTYLHGTNNSEFPGLDNSVEVGSFIGGEEAEFMTRVRNRPFTFKEEKEQFVLETYESHSRKSRWAIRAIAKRVLNEVLDI